MSDLRDTLERIAEAYNALLEDGRLQRCQCGEPGTGEACDVCEISYLLSEALDCEEEPHPQWVTMTEAEKDEAIRKAV